MLKLIVGLGNPGPEYAATRHNAGFTFVEELALKLKSNFSNESKYWGALARLRMANHDLFLLKPYTYMNLSGKSVQAVANFYKINPDEILVAHDELDFRPGIIKLKQGGGSGGHNGLKDVTRVLGNNYWRLRIGIGHPGDPAQVSSYVLTRPPLAEKIEIELAIGRAVAVDQLLVAGDFAVVQKLLHTTPK